jgi:hypothetical protein
LDPCPNDRTRLPTPYGVQPKGFGWTGVGLPNPSVPSPATPSCATTRRRPAAPAPTPVSLAAIIRDGKPIIGRIVSRIPRAPQRAAAGARSQ